MEQIIKEYEQEIEEVWERIKKFEPEQLMVVGSDVSRILPFMYFDADHTGNMKDALVGLYYTVHLNGTEPATLVTPEEEIVILD